jgi:hypothetical protein
MLGTCTAASNLHAIVWGGKLALLTLFGLMNEVRSVFACAVTAVRGDLQVALDVGASG